MAVDNTWLDPFAIHPVLACSNNAPSFSQTQDILKSIAHGKSELLSLQTEIRQAKEALASLEQKQESMKSLLMHQESLLSPIRRIPPEILGQIFLELRGLSDPICFGDEALENVGLWSLLHVCRFWREVALSYSELWSEFNIIRQPFSRPSERGENMTLRRILRLTKHCTSYSGSRPLKFVFDGDERLLCAARLLALQSTRWSSVVFNSFPVLQALEPEIHDQLPTLHSLGLDASGKEWDPLEYPLRLFSRAPSLTRLSLGDFDHPQDRFIFPWHQITHFTSFGLRQFLPILPLMRSLVSFTSIKDICRPDEIQGRVPLPNLEHLEVISNSPTTIQIFDVLCTPKLSSLCLFSKRGFSRIYATAIVQMIKLSECTLKTLSITDYAIDSIIHILNEVRDLEELDVTNVMYPSELLGGLGNLLPRLRTLVLWKCDPDPKLGLYLTQMACDRARREEVQDRSQSLTKISVGLSCAPEPRFFKGWNETVYRLGDLGLQVELIDLFRPVNTSR